MGKKEKGDIQAGNDSEFQRKAGLKKTINGRQKEMKVIGKEIAKSSNKKKSQALKTSSKTKLKLGRNDPCPCGSGKKYKSAVLTNNFLLVQLGQKGISPKLLS